MFSKEIQGKRYIKIGVVAVTTCSPKKPKDSILGFMERLHKQQET
jgi:hypothetical protein